MAALTFSEDDADTVIVRKAVFRLLLSRAAARLTDPADIEELELSEVMEGISFNLLDDDQRARLVDALYEGTTGLEQEIAAGAPIEEAVRAGIDEKLDEVRALLARFRSQTLDE